MSRYRYRRWDGTQDPFGFDLPVDELTRRLSEDLLDGWTPDESLRRMLEEGLDGRFSGLDALRERLARLREEAERRGNLGSPLREIEERLDQIVGMEKLELSLDDSSDARFAELTLDALPDRLSDRISELRQYPFVSQQARNDFESLLDELRSQLLDQQFSQISQAMTSPDPAELAALKDMLADLNDLMDKRAAGLGPTQREFDEFMAKHGRFFPEQPSTFDELLEVMAARAAAASRFLASLSPEQRAELMALSEALLDDIDLRFQVDRAGRALRSLMPGMAWDEPVDMDGASPYGLGDGLAAIDELSRLDALEQALAQDYPGASLDDIDPDELGRALGEDAARDLRRLREIEQALERAGVVVKSRGRMELTPRGVRKLGERALARVFSRLTADRPGDHEVPVAGGVGERLGSSRPWVFGDSFRLDLRRTLHNAVIRSGPSNHGISLAPEDFEIEEFERRTSVATVLLLDMSRSMPLRGHWQPAKRMALALHTLISTAYPEDHLSIVTFSDYARVVSPQDLATVDWEPVYGTNMEHAFSLAGRLLAKHRDASKQVLLVTDGEPTAHLEGEHVFFQWPPARETIRKTFVEAGRLAKSGVTMNVFMLEDSPGLVAFIDRLTKMVGGRVFETAGDELGDMVVREYLKN